MNHEHSKTNNQSQTTDNRLRTTKKELRKINLFIQNKPNLPKAQMNASKVLEMDYGNIRLHRRPKTNPIQTQSKPIQTQYEPKTNPISNFSLWDLEEVRGIYCLCFTRTASKYKPRLQNKLQTRIWPVCTRDAIHLHRSATEVSDSSGTVPTATWAAVNSSMIRQRSLS